MILSMKYSVEHCVASRDMIFIPIFFYNHLAVAKVEMGVNGSLVTTQTPFSFFYEGRLAKNNNAHNFVPFSNLIKYRSIPSAGKTNFTS